MSASSIRLALWQCESRPRDVDGNLARLDRSAADAAAHDADLLVTPEMFVTGYNIGADAAVLADPPSGPIADTVAEIARRHGIAILYGCPQREPGGAVHNTIRLVSDTGETLAAHHKTHLFGELDRTMVTPGDAPGPVVQVAGWSVGMLTCYEVEFPEMVRSLAVRDADIVCVPTANMIEFDAVQQVLLPARALENQVVVAYANYCGVEGELQYGGLTEVVGAGGDVRAHAGRTPELLIVDVDRDELEASRRRNPYLADRRPELY